MEMQDVIIFVMSKLTQVKNEMIKPSEQKELIGMCIEQLHDAVSVYYANKKHTDAEIAVLKNAITDIKNELNAYKPIERCDCEVETK